MDKLLIVVTALVLSSNANACLGITDERVEWIQTKTEFVLGLIVFATLLVLINAIINWRGIWKIPFMGYAIFLQLFHLSWPIEINNSACQVMKEEVSEAILLLGIIIIIYEVSFFIKWLTSHNKKLAPNKALKQPSADRDAASGAP